MPSRYARPSPASIAAQIARIRRARDEAPLREAQAELATVLDGLNALDALDTLRQRALTRVLSGGPLAVQGAAPVPWVGALIWQRAPGYFGYKTLTLYGLWALQLAEGVELRTGVRRLAYILDFYEADAYHKRIRREYALYYGEQSAPPTAEDAAWTAHYHTDQRLALRDDLNAVLAGLVSGG